ncbi:MAG: hypothetical protein LWW86_14455 [Micrococcales bacterium]|nr:hypothetical protein [Micrococcales bacterium]
MSILAGLVVRAAAAIVVTALLETAAEGRPWKVKAYRRRGLFVVRLHSEVLPTGVEPEERMCEVLAELTGISPGSTAELADS